MKIAEIGSFLNPFGDALATTFVLTLIILTILTVIWLLSSAKESNWEKNWYGGDLNDSTNNLDGEHGSVQELSDAVATKAEKVADIMPSMLLIVGLLGTFLGLGIALNKASTVLAMADTAGMDAAMSQLMGLMDGLGAKFKTSTWGILCFILLNLLFNIFGFKEKRLTWAIKKVREESEEKIKTVHSRELERHDALISLLQNLNNNTKENSQRLIETLTSSNESHLNSQAKLHSEILTTLHDQHEASQKITTEQINQLNNGFLTIGQIRNDLNKNRQLFIDSLNENHQATLSEQKELFSGIKSSLDKNNQLTTTNAKNSIKELKKIADSNEATQQSMQDFVKETVGSMESIGQSADQMALAATEVGKSAEGLNGVVKGLRNELEGIMTTIKKDLSETINHMGESFEENMADMSESMSKATLGISSAVAELSTSVDKTMTDVTNVISESMELQRKSANEFTVTSETLNVQIFEMTDLVKQLSGDITSGLKAVSESGRRMKSLDSRYAKYSDLIENVTATNQEIIEQINLISKELPTMANAVPKLSKNLQDTFKKSVLIQQESKQAIENLSDEIKNALASDNSSVSKTLFNNRKPKN